MKAANINGQWFFVNTNTGRHVKCHNRVTAQELARVARTGIRPHGNGKDANHFPEVQPQPAQRSKSYRLKWEEMKIFDPDRDWS
tara:strand:+ start:217 stop:468 length:252 start_codon:yes stop_codon:yes gene_type:complete